MKQVLALLILGALIPLTEYLSRYTYTSTDTAERTFIYTQKLNLEKYEKIGIGKGWIGVFDMYRYKNGGDGVLVYRQ